MSEYQYYEFQAIDRPLDAKAMRALRALSTRARITATSFVNTYNWGDFRGDPRELMERWFDLHLYYADWGTRQFSIRAPKSRLDRARFDSLALSSEFFHARTSGENIILDFYDEEEDPDPEPEEDGSGWLAALAPLRGDLLAGDMRLLHVAWLKGVAAGSIDDAAREPLPGLAPLTATLAALADFLRVDDDLVCAAAEPIARPDGKRTAADLRARAREFRERWEAEAAAQEEAERRRLEREAAKARRERLDAVKRRGDRVWSEIEAEILRRQPQSYDRAARLLFDLKTLAEESGGMAAFSNRVRSLRARHARKERFLERIVKLDVR